MPIWQYACIVDVLVFLLRNDHKIDERPTKMNPKFNTLESMIFYFYFSNKHVSTIT